MKKKRYQKPRMIVKKYNAFYFGCGTGGQGCSTIARNINSPQTATPGCCFGA